jgi:hypothetical protein
MQLVQDRAKRPDAVNTEAIIYLRFQNNTRNFLSNWMNISLSWRTLLHVVRLVSHQFCFCFTGRIITSEVGQIRYVNYHESVLVGMCHPKIPQTCQMPFTRSHQLSRHHNNVTVRIQPSDLILRLNSRVHSCSKEAKNVAAGWHFEVLLVFSNFATGRFGWMGGGNCVVAVGTDMFSSRQVLHISWTGAKFYLCFEQEYCGLLVSSWSRLLPYRKRTSR